MGTHARCRLTANILLLAAPATSGVEAESCGAADSGGNLLSFRMGDGGDAVYLWDHDFGTVRQIAPSFVALLEAYCALPRGSGSVS